MTFRPNTRNGNNGNRGNRPAPKPIFTYGAPFGDDAEGMFVNVVAQKVVDFGVVVSESYPVEVVTGETINAQNGKSALDNLSIAVRKTLKAGLESPGISSKGVATLRYLVASIPEEISKVDRLLGSCWEKHNQKLGALVTAEFDKTKRTAEWIIRNVLTTRGLDERVAEHAQATVNYAANNLPRAVARNLDEVIADAQSQLTEAEQAQANGEALGTLSDKEKGVLAGDLAKKRSHLANVTATKDALLGAEGEVTKLAAKAKAGATDVFVLAGELIAAQAALKSNGRYARAFGVQKPFYKKGKRVK
jgi:hypothetical protein